MSNIHNLEIDVDLKENLIITATCKQLDDLNLTFNVWNNGEMADLNAYKCRLKAFKQDQIPLIQNTDIKISNNVITIDADEQLTTTSGIIKAELQFINKNTGKKKSTFNIVFKVIQSVLEIERSISKATCTLLKEIDNKLDRIEDIGDVLEEAKEVRDKLTNTTIPGATSINSKLETSTKNASSKITEVKNIITDASNKIEEVETSVNNADSSKKELDLSKTNADISKENLDTANTLAEKNIEELNSLGNVTDLAKNVQTNTTDIGTLKENVENNTSQLKDLTKHFYWSLQDINSNFTNNTPLETVCEIMSDNSILQTRVYGGIYPSKAYAMLIIEKSTDMIATLTYTIPTSKTTSIQSWRKDKGLTGWKQLATTENTQLTLLNGWRVAWDGLATTVAKSGNIVTINTLVTGGTTAKNTVICTSPYAPRTAQTFVLGAWSTSSIYSHLIVVNPNGDIVIDTVDAKAPNIALSFSYTI